MLLTAISLLGKVIFMLYNAGEHCTLQNIWNVLWTGLPLDLSVAGLLTLPVWMVTAATMYYPNLRLRASLLPYLVVVLLFVVIVTIGDIVMYHHFENQYH